MYELPEDHFVKAHQFTQTTHRDVYPAIDPTAASNSQAGKVVVITGVSRGIGRSGIVPAFAKSNPKAMVIVARSADTLETVAREIHAINKDIEVLAISAELASQQAITGLWEKVKETFGHADVLINNAAASHEKSLTDSSPELWWNTFEVNVRGTFLNVVGFLKLLGKERRGSIVNLTSSTAVTIIPTVSSYSLSKLAALQMQAFVAAENPNVTAVALHPGMVPTDLTLEEFRRFAKDTPELIGGLAVFLSTEKADFLNGKYIASNWSVDELMARKEEIISEGKLSIALKGEFGAQQFE